MEKRNEMSSKKALKIAVVVIVVLAVLVVKKSSYYRVCYHAINAIETLKLPDDIEVVYTSKATVSDIYYPHVRAEKVIRCERGEEYLSKYIEDNNSFLDTLNIKVWSLSGMSDMAMYEFDLFPEKEQKEILADGVDKYINITYEKKIFWAPVSWYLAEPVAAR